MQDTLTVNIPAEIKAALENITQIKGISSDELVSTAIKDYLFVHQFNSLRIAMLQKSQSQYTDEDIFNIVS